MKPLADIHNVYCIGLGGVGVSAVAKLFLARGVKVSGSDPRWSPIVADVVRCGAKHFTEPDARRLTPEIDLVVATDDAPADHPERLAAATAGIDCENFSITLSRFMAEYPRRITIAGTNGKSTTTALTGLLLVGAQLDPTVFVGSRVAEFDGNVRIGRGTVFVAEADEYQDHFLHYQPTTAVITNIEPDHLDYFTTVERMEESFQKYATVVPPGNQLILNFDDLRSRPLLNIGRQVFTFGRSTGAYLQARNIIASPGQQTWETFLHGESLGSFTLHLPGTFNIMNALAAMTAALSVGADPSTFAATIASFHGIWRRFQVLNPAAEVTIISDYAHHPTAVQATLVGARAFYTGRRIVAVFQPHHHSRLSALFTEFAKSFTAADETLIVETYSVPGRDVLEQQSKTARQLVSAINELGVVAHYLGPVPDAEQQLRTRLQPGDVAIIMGAGDIWTTAEALGTFYV